MQKPITAIIVLILLALVVGLNNQLTSSPTKTPAPETEAKSKEAAAKAPAKPDTAYMPNTPSTAPVAEAVIGMPTAPLTVSLGYTWDDAVQQKPDELKKIIIDVENWGAVAGHHAQIVCIDIPPDQREYAVDSNVALGLAVNGKTVPSLAGNPGVGFTAKSVEALLATVK